MDIIYCRKFVRKKCLNWMRLATLISRFETNFWLSQLIKIILIRLNLDVDFGKNGKNLEEFQTTSFQFYMNSLSHLSQYCAKSRHNFVSIIMTLEKETNKKLHLKNSFCTKNVALLLCPIYVAFCVRESRHSNIWNDPMGDDSKV